MRVVNFIKTEEGAKNKIAIDRKKKKTFGMVGGYRSVFLGKQVLLPFPWKSPFPQQLRYGLTKIRSNVEHIFAIVNPR